MNNLGLLLSLQGRLDEAAEWLGRVYALELRLSGPDAPDTLFAIHNLAGVKCDPGRPGWGAEHAAGISSHGRQKYSPKVIRNLRCSATRMRER